MRTILKILMAGSLFLTLLAFPTCTTLIAWRTVRADLYILTQMNMDQSARIKELTDEIRRLKNPRHVERILRDEWGYMRKGDVEIVF